MSMAAKPVAPSSEVQQKPARAGAVPGGPDNENRQLPREITIAILIMAFSEFWASPQAKARTTPIMLAAYYFCLLLAFLSSLPAFLPFNDVDRWLGLRRALAYISCGSFLLATFLRLISLSLFNVVAFPALLLIFVVALCGPGARHIGVDPQNPDLKDMIYDFSVKIVTAGGGVFGSFSGSSMLMTSKRFEWAGTAFWILLFLVVAIGIVLMLFVKTIEAEWRVNAAINLHIILVVLVAMVCVLSFIIVAFGRGITA